ncbi:ATP-dependent DNA helicase RecG [Candidatus Saccharibacteria bacterium]|nr:ATP-dependent DNA helicase RecG [Candidatus Saccharibacteria bacterium]
MVVYIILTESASDWRAGGERNVTEELNLDTAIRYLKGVGEKQAELFAKLDIATIGDLIRHRPRRWDDFSKVSQIADLSPGKVTVKARILEAKGRYTGYRGMHLTEALAEDGSGGLRLVWFNQPYRAASLQTGRQYYLSGLYDLRYRRLQMINPTAMPAEEELPQLVQAVYPTTAGLRNAQIRRALAQARSLLPKIKEPLPAWLAAAGDLRPLAETYDRLHFPPALEAAEAAAAQLGLRELVALSLSSRLLRLQRQRQSAAPIAFKREAVEELVGGLDFELTSQQKRIIGAVLKEMAAPKTPLNRLVQGDVGAGKTLIAAAVAFNVMENGYQAAFLAPTQILARQHFDNLRRLYGRRGEGRVELLSSASSAAEQNRVRRRLAEGQTSLVVGTHSLLSDSVKFDRLALAVIDEQHRFGVKQRLKLLQKAEPELANILTLSATPIPRSLALVLYADLDISLLTEKPPGRLEVETAIVPLGERAARLREVIKTRSAANQLFIVCPAIEDPEAEDSLAKTQALIKNLAPDLKFGVLHARLKTEEKERVLKAFQRNELEALLSTSIIEAGLDIPGANTVIIMSPEKFGLAQLHQLRGRVGRSRQQGYCYLCPFSDQKPSERLQALLEHRSGFKLSEIDLRLRGPGTLHGLRQSGPSAVLEGLPISPRTVRLAAELAETFIERGEDLADFPALAAAVADYQQVTHLN